MTQQQIGNSPNKKSTGVDLDELGNSHQFILIVEDDPDTVMLLKQILLSAGFDVRSACSGREAMEKIALQHPDLVLLDLMMPEMDGWETFGYIRKVMDVPVVILSALAIKDEIVKALQLGVDDYITKPFYNAEVIARVKSVLRRAQTSKTDQRISIPQLNLIMDLNEQYVSINGDQVNLTPREFAIFSLLLRQAPGVVKYSAITQAVWGEDSPDARKRTKFIIYLIRKKLCEVMPGREIIQNLDRIGYKIKLDSGN